jgi:hypothetical protein
MGSMRRPLRVLLFTAALCAAMQAHAQVYKCVDAKGKTVYSQVPCPSGASATVLGTKPPAAPVEQPPTKDAAAKADPSKPAAKDPSKPTTAADQDLEFRKRQEERAEAEKKSAAQAADAQRKQEECRRAREQVAQYEIGGRITRMDDKGERVFLDDAQMAQEKAKWQSQADQACR